MIRKPRNAQTLRFHKETPATLREQLCQYDMGKERAGDMGLTADEWLARRKVLLHELAILEGWING